MYGMIEGGAAGCPNRLASLAAFFSGMQGGLLHRAAQPGQPGLDRLALVVDNRKDIGEDEELVGSIPLLGRPAVDHRVGKSRRHALALPTRVGS